MLRLSSFRLFLRRTVCLHESLGASWPGIECASLSTQHVILYQGEPHEVKNKSAKSKGRGAAMITLTLKQLFTREESVLTDLGASLTFPATRLKTKQVELLDAPSDKVTSEYVVKETYGDAQYSVPSELIPNISLSRTYNLTGGSLKVSLDDAGVPIRTRWVDPLIMKITACARKKAALEGGPVVDTELPFQAGDKAQVDLNDMRVVSRLNS